MTTSLFPEILDQNLIPEDHTSHPKTAKSNRNDGRRSAARAGGDAGIGPAIRPDPGWGRIRGFGRFVGQVHHDSAAHGTDHAEHRVQGKAGGL